MSLTRKAIVVAVLLLAGFFGWRQFFYAPVTNAHPSGSNIIAFGDSLTAGVGAGAGEDYPSQLSKLCGCEVLNRGVAGETTADAMKRLDSDVLRQDPKIVIVLLGGNDMLQRQPVSETFARLDTIVERIESHGALVVLVGIKGLLFTDQHGPEYKRVARARGAVFVPDVLNGILDHPKLKSDQVHPNAPGYKIMAERIYAAVKPYL
jgi:acyl-CoA thioesterase-1